MQLSMRDKHFRKGLYKKMKLKGIFYLRLIGIFQFLGICCFPSLANGQDNDSCSTPQGQPGKCIELHDCSELTNFIRQNGLQSYENVNFLRSRICRYRRKNVLMCCVEEASKLIRNAGDPDRDPGTTSNPAIIPPMRECGFSTTKRIIGGKREAHGDHPWLVGIGVLQGGKFKIYCGGTLITKRHVLTAAHCFGQNPTLTHVRLGEHSLTQNNELIPPVTLRIKEHKNPGYVRLSQLNDIELLTLEKDIDFNLYVRPACLPFNISSKNFDDTVTKIVGWGHTMFGSNSESDVPLAANISVWSKEKCLKAYNQFKHLDLEKTTVCAAAPGKDACQGDSGGPMLYYKREINRNFLLGIVSFGVGCGNAEFPGVYTFVPAYENWIKTNL